MSHFTAVRGRKAAVDRIQAPKRAFRPDIQGLRAVAVLAVVAEHLFQAPRGGFVGVDVFFVVSGFLITGHLIHELEVKGRISFVGFYKRRVRRLMPAAVITVVATALVSTVIMTGPRAREIGVDSIWALLFSANWRFASDGTDYFEASGPVSPLQHFWSLAVEEQFYLVWPMVLLASFYVARLIRLRGKSVTAAVVLCTVLISFAWALTETENSPTWAYFSTFSRAWELGVGALLALAATHLERIPQYLRPVLAWGGLGGLVFSFLFISEERLFPAPWALLPVVSAALIILAGTGGRPFSLRALNNRPMSYIGDISYSLYLWHFPVIILMAAVFDSGWVYYSVVMLLTLSLSVVSYHFIEQTFRSSKKARTPVGVVGNKNRYVGLAVLSALTVASTILAIQQHSPAQAFAVENPISVPVAEGVLGDGDVEQKSELELEINRALAATEWPNLIPSVNELADAKPEEESQGCGTQNLEDRTACVFGDSDLPELVIFGDSTGLTLLPTVREAMGDRYRIRTMSLPGCPVIDLNMRFVDKEREESCVKYRTEAVLEINETQPAVVMLTNTYSAALELASKAGSAEASTEWQEAIRSTMEMIAPSGSRVLAVAPPPVGLQLEECATPLSSPRDCVSEVPAIWKAISAAERQAVGNSNYIDTSKFFCAANNLCPSFVGVTPTKRDAVHTTPQYAITIAPYFEEEVTQALAVP